MQKFNSSLLREKFVITDINGDDAAATVALSNRFVVELQNPQRGSAKETYIVRGHNMHSVVRMAARILHDFDNGGPISVRVPEYDWAKAWDSIVNDYEYAYNPDRWIAIYKDGKCVFEAGKRHPFLDMIEKCDTENDQEYDYAVPLAEAMFQSAGKDMQIHHDSNVALTVNVEDGVGRIGIILRGSNKTTTFSFSVRSKSKVLALNVPQSLGAAAGFLEGIQLAFFVGMNREKIRIGLIKRPSKDEKQTKDGNKRLGRLASEITNLENGFEVRYRPEKPEFHLLLEEAEQLGQRILEPAKDE